MFLSDMLLVELFVDLVLGLIFLMCIAKGSQLLKRRCRQDQGSFYTWVGIQTKALAGARGSMT